MKKNKFFNLLVLTIAFNVFVAAIVLGVVPKTSNVSAQTVSSKLVLNSTTGIYNSPSDTTPVAYLAPQTVNVTKTFHLIDTWLGPKFIKFDYMSPASNKVVLTVKTGIYNNPSDTIPVAYLAPQTVNVTENWYLIDTWLGSKYIVSDVLTSDAQQSLVIDNSTIKADGTVVKSNGVTLQTNGSVVGANGEPVVTTSGKVKWTISGIQTVLKKNSSKVQSAINKGIDKLPFISKATKAHWKKVVVVESVIKALSSISGFTGTVEDGLTKAFVKIGLPSGVAGVLARTISFIFF